MLLYSLGAQQNHIVEKWSSEEKQLSGSRACTSHLLGTTTMKSVYKVICDVGVHTSVQAVAAPCCAIGIPSDFSLYFQYHIMLHGS